MHPRLSRFSPALVEVMTFSAAACSDGPTTVITPAAVTVTITPPPATVVFGQQVGFVAVVANDTDGTLSGVTWASSDPAVMAVHPTSGIGIAGSPGVADIRATSKHRPSVSAVVTVTVSAPPTPLAVTLPALNTGFSIGQQVTLQAAVGGDTTGTSSGVTWTSSNPCVLEVNSGTGAATARSAGQTRITATSRWRPGVSDTATATVLAAPSVGVMTVLGQCAVNERYTAEIAATGNFAYTTTWSTRSFGGTSNRGDAVKIWDVTGPTPRLLDSLKISGVGTTSDVQISPDGSLLVVSTEGLNSGSIVIYSMATPAKPALLNRFQNLNTTRGVHTVKLSTIGGRLYAFMQIDPSPSAPAALMIVDITNPMSPQQVYYQPMGRPYIHDVFIRDGLLFAALWNDGMTIFDVGGGGRGGSPSNPVQISNVRTPTGQIHNIWWLHDPATGAKKYAILGEEGPGGVPSNSSGDIHVIDVSDLAAPRQVAVYSVPGAGAHNFSVDEQSQILYAAYYNGGIRALDVRGDLGTCTNAQKVQTGAYAGLCDLRLMGREAGTALTTGGFVWGVTLQGNRLYASDMAKGIVALDVTALKR